MSQQESEDAVKALAKEKDLLEREKWELRRQAKEATDHASALRSQLDLKDNRMKELEAELAMVSSVTRRARAPRRCCGSSGAQNASASCAELKHSLRCCTRAFAAGVAGVVEKRPVANEELGTFQARLDGALSNLIW